MEKIQHDSLKVFFIRRTGERVNSKTKSSSTTNRKYLRKRGEYGGRELLASGSGMDLIYPRGFPCVPVTLSINGKYFNINSLLSFALTAILWISPSFSVLMHQEFMSMGEPFVWSASQSERKEITIPPLSEKKVCTSENCLHGIAFLADHSTL